MTQVILKLEIFDFSIKKLIVSFKYFLKKDKLEQKFSIVIHLIS